MVIKDTDELEDNSFLWEERVKLGRVAKRASVFSNAVYPSQKKNYSSKAEHLMLVKTVDRWHLLGVTIWCISSFSFLLNYLIDKFF